MAAPTFVADEVVTATKMNDLPKGILGYATGADQTGMTTEVDLTGLSVAVTVAAGRRLKLTAYVSTSPSAASAHIITLRIKEGATVLQLAHVSTALATQTGLTAIATITPSAGAHTYKATLQRTSGAGTIDVQSGGLPADAVAFLLVEDLGSV